MSESKINKGYFKLNPTNVVYSLNDINVPIQPEYKPAIDENVTDFSNTELIQRVFENKGRSFIAKNSSYAKGGSTKKGKQETWSPYEFLHTLLPKVYGKDYVISDNKAEDLNATIRKEENLLNELIDEKLKKHSVETIFQLPIEVFEDIDTRRKALENKKIFISHKELDAFVMSHPELKKENYVKKINSNRDELIEAGLLLLDMRHDNEVNWVYRYEYLSGDIDAKTTDIQTKKVDYLEHMTEEQYQRQIDSLNEVRNPMAQITYEGKNKIFINPNSYFAQSEKEFAVHPEDWSWDDMATRDMSLAKAFSFYLKSEEIGDEEIKVARSRSQIIKFYVNGEKPDTDDAMDAMDLIENAQIDGERLFDKFLNEALNEETKIRLKALWNKKYNNLVPPIMYKIPVALTLSKTFKDGSEFIPNPTQIQSVQFMKTVGSGLLAYGVGVGKTASSILNVSYALDNEFAKKPMFVVPNSTFDKWIFEIKGGVKTIYKVIYEVDGKKREQVYSEKREANKFKKEVKGKLKEEQKTVQGLLPHINKIVPLYNLNADVVKNEVKIYSDEEKETMKKMEELRNYIKDLSPQTDLGNPKVNERIRELYDDYEYSTIEAQYRSYAWERERKGKTVMTLFEFFRKGVYKYIRTLPYILGEVREFEDNTIFLLTHEGLKNLGIEKLDSANRNTVFRENTDHEFHQIFTEYSQGERADKLLAYGNESKELQLLEQAYFGTADKPKIYLTDIGIDYAVYDESHFFKKLFTKTKGRAESPDFPQFRNDGLLYKDKPKYDLGRGGYASDIALSAYVTVRHIQNKHNGGNVCHLTATPFTNEPVEVYSMLAMTNYPLLKESGFSHIEDFYDVFMRISFDVAYSTSQNVERRQVLTGYNNAPQMRNLIFFMMDYKSGDDANIKRPDKFMMPSYQDNIDTIIPPTGQQEELFSMIRKYIQGELTVEDICDVVGQDIDVVNMGDDELIRFIVESGSSSQADTYSLYLGTELNDATRSNAESVARKIVEKLKEEEEKRDVKEEPAVVRVLKGLNFMKSATLSPHLFSCRKVGSGEPNYKEFVESSPKIMYAVNCIKSIHDYEKENNPYKGGKDVPKLSGQVIYTNTGVNPKLAVKDGDTYRLVNWEEPPFEKIKTYFVEELGYDESQISIVKGGMSKAKKEKEKNKFLAGDSVVLIGSATISTGVDLQNNASALFTLSFDWNPTDNEQVNGRVHRQGNRFANVRIVYPMIENSFDPVIFQLLQEKTLRIKEIWDRDGKTSTLDLKDFNPEALKEKLITDPQSRAEFWFFKNSQELKHEKNALENRIKELRNASDDFETLEDLREPVKAMLTALDHYKKHKKQKEGNEKFEEKMAEITMKYRKEPQKMVKEIEKLNKDNYDHEEDPENRYEPESFMDLDDEELLKKVLNNVLNSNSWGSKNISENRDEINDFVRMEYPNWAKGVWVTEEELNQLMKELDELREKQEEISRQESKQESISHRILSELDYNYEEAQKNPEYIESKEKFDTLNQQYRDLRTEIRDKQTRIKRLNGGYKIEFSWYGNDIVGKARDWKNAKRLFDKRKERLAVMGIEAKDIDEAKQLMVDRIKEIDTEISALEDKIPDMIEKFKKEQEENRAVAPTLSERVDEFAQYNPKFLTLDASLSTFKEDKEPVSKVVEKPKKKTEKKPKEEVDEATFLKNKIEAFEMMVDMEEDEEEIQFLKDKIEAFEMMLEMEEV